MNTDIQTTNDDFRCRMQYFYLNDVRGQLIRNVLPTKYET